MTRLGADQRGSMSVFAAGLMLLLTGMAALSVDAGLWYLKRRDLQNATDAAALAAASGQSANAVMAQNGFAAGNIASATQGYYCPTPGASPASRFSASAGPGCLPAARVDATADVPLFFARPFLHESARQLHVTATAARLDAAGLRAGTALASISTSDALIMNAALNSLLGGANIGLSAAHYSALAATDITARNLLGALDARLSLSAGTYRQLLSATASVDDVLGAAITALSGPDAGADAATAIAGLQLLAGKVPATRAVSIGKLFSLGVWQDVAVDGPAAINGGVNALQLATAAIQLANGKAAAQTAQSVSLPGGLATAAVEISAIEPPQDAWFAFGPAGTSVHTAQVRMKLWLRLIGQTVQLPLYVELGSGDARLSSIDCGDDPAADTAVTVMGKTAAADVYLGTVSASAAAMANFSTPVTVGTAWLLNTPPLLGLVVGVGARAQVHAGGSAETGVTFTRSGSTATIGTPPDPGLPAQISATGIAGGIGAGLLGSLQIATNPATVDSLVNALLQPIISGLVTNTIQPLLAVVDPTLDALMAALGVKVGVMDLWVPGVRCGVPVLVT